MKKLIKNIVLLGLFFCLQPLSVNAEKCSAGAKIEIKNAGFESLIVDNVERWNIFSNGTKDLGWSVKWYGDIESRYSDVRPKVANLEIQKGVYPWSAYEGNQFCELDSDWNGPASEIKYGQTGEPASVSISQDIETIPGASYELKFAFSPRPNTSWLDNVLQVSWNGLVVDVLSASGTPQTVWNEYTYILKATEVKTRLQFTDLGNPDSFGTFIDGVSLAVKDCPEANKISSGGGIRFFSNYNKKDEIIVLGSDTSEDMSVCELEALDIASVVMMPENNERDVALFHKVYNPDLGVNDTKLARLAYFISSDGDCSKHLGAGERAGVVDSFKSAFNRLPLSYDDWLDVLKIGNGQWPNLRSEIAESRAMDSFKSIYNRDANMENDNDNTAVNIMAYGIRPKPRAIEKETIATEIFFKIKGYNPTSALEWDIARAIGYSGATR